MTSVAVDVLVDKVEKVKFSTLVIIYCTVAGLDKADGLN